MFDELMTHMFDHMTRCRLDCDVFVCSNLISFDFFVVPLMFTGGEKQELESLVFFYSLLTNASNQSMI